MTTTPVSTKPAPDMAVEAAKVVQWFKEAYRAKPTALNGYKIRIWSELEERLAILLAVSRAPVAVGVEPNCLPKSKLYMIERHGSGWAIYQGRDQSHHGYNLGQLTETDDKTAAILEAALNATPSAGAGGSVGAELRNEKIMKQWDYWRAQIASGDKSSGPRDWFESVLESLATPAPSVPIADVAPLLGSLAAQLGNAVQAQDAAPVPAGVQGDAERLGKALRLKACLLDGHDPFVFYVDGMMTARVLSGIDNELTANKDDLFKDGQGDYEFTATHFDGQYGFEGRCELAPGWEFEQIGFEALTAPAADGSES